MADYTVLIVGDADRWWTSMSLAARSIPAGLRRRA